MGNSILHITNGDSTTNCLKKLKFSGDFITWREMLCEGKTTTDVGSESFWKNRFDFFKNSYKVSKKKFIDFTLKEYRNLCNKKESKEIVLWFEYDLFCQINMIAVISWLKTYRKGYHISLVCSGNVKDSKKLKGLGELTENQIHQHYKNRVYLTQDDIEYADYIWQLYCSDSPLRLETVYKFNPMSPFQYLASAIEAHLLRFPSIDNGLSTIENTILETANTHNLLSKHQLVGELLKSQEIYGFGDLQYEHKIDKLQKLFTSFDPVKLSRKGKKILANEINYYGELRNENSYLGGAKKYSFLFNNQSEKLLQITS
ncbi:DUF1835 domain-containing protein [Polaribacter aquimarinus]|uniref:DUF1835 domain-containing protein n=1 Tax=Polaribacter aquimarinus TaxID=2100726 RepID=A0A2U2J831_9FLAO|nr:DUF1835 domain-containing protein [Polaribacter aquimarinus]PWG04462.1 DUF1835 domain-containing protein [Polaribacter aquimarinus]